MAFRKKRVLSQMNRMSADITAAMRELGDRSRFVHPEIWARWFHIAGDHMYKRTFPKLFKNQVLTIGVSNSAWLQELNLLKPRLLDRLAEEVGPNVVKDIRMVIDSDIGRHRPREWHPEKPVFRTPDPSKLSKEILDATDRVEDAQLAESIRNAAALYQDK